ncbi:hypothetical protein ACIRQQ_02410 [Streptomyces fuscichromogenes]|uniref:hypothetical protein n=1 Tax=Streptomyces fuscichromogenes TaxID=1324013 RepID=UPI00380088ED
MSDDQWKDIDPGSGMPVSRSRRRAEQRRRRRRRQMAWAVAVGAVLLGAATSFAAHRLHFADRGDSTAPKSAPARSGHLDLSTGPTRLGSFLDADTVAVVLGAKAPYGT